MKARHRKQRRARASTGVDTEFGTNGLPPAGGHAKRAKGKSLGRVHGVAPKARADRKPRKTSGRVARADGGTLEAYNSGRVARGLRPVDSVMSEMGRPLLDRQDARVARGYPVAGAVDYRGRAARMAPDNPRAARELLDQAEQSQTVYPSEPDGRARGGRSPYADKTSSRAEMRFAERQAPFNSKEAAKTMAYARRKAARGE